MTYQPKGIDVRVGGVRANVDAHELARAMRSHSWANVRNSIGPAAASAPRHAVVDAVADILDVAATNSERTDALAENLIDTSRECDVWRRAFENKVGVKE